MGFKREVPKDHEERCILFWEYCFLCMSLSYIDGPSLIRLQVLSGEQPWSEVHEDTAIVLYLAQGRKPGRPKSRSIDDQHWNFINFCWSPIQERRPASGCIVSMIEQFLDQHPPAQPIRDLVASLSRHKNSRRVRGVPEVGSRGRNGMQNTGEDGW